MYDNYSARTRTARRTALVAAFATTVVMALGAAGTRARAQDLQSPSVVRKISSLSEKMELITNTSRILTLDKNIPRVQVNNPELLAVTPLSANQVQISAKKAGVTQVNLWDEDGKIHTVDVLIYGDARELEVALQTQFPNSTIKVYRYSESLVLKGFVDRPDYVSQIMRLAEDYAPKVINNINVGGVQQVLLKVRVYEVSRTKLRQLGVDWAFFSDGKGFAVNSAADLIIRPSPLNFHSFIPNPSTAVGESFSFGIVDGADEFFGILNALQENQVAKILAEPNLVAISGRPAQFNVGGEIPVPVPQSLGTTTIEFKAFGTQVDFLPIVLGNGNIRLEVRPRISFLDPANGVVINGSNIPAFNVRQVDTAVEMKAGQTFALAGLVQERTDTVNRGLPYVSDLPIIGVPFRRTADVVNEIELLVMVTPEFVDAMDPHEAPCGGPGFATTPPDNHDLYCTGHVEVPAHCNPTRGMTACGECSGCQSGGGCNCGPNGGHNGVITDGMHMPGGVGYEGESYGPTTVTDQAPGGSGPTPVPAAPGTPAGQSPAMPDDLPLPPGGAAPPTGESPNGAGIIPPGNSFTGQPNVLRGSPEYSTPRPYSPPRQPVFMRNAANPNNPQQSGVPATSGIGETGLIGPVGYDVQ
jgi:pilus assembly protein CpaC